MTLFMATNETDRDELKKYSYLISGDTVLPGSINAHVQGTGFFVKKKKKIFFVCAKHTLSGCNNDNVKDPRTPEVMNILLADRSIAINVKTLKETANCLPVQLEPDVYAVPINENEIKGSSINFINIEENIPKINIEEEPKKYSEIVFYGFPDKQNGLTTFSAMNVMVFTNNPMEYQGKWYTDSINYSVAIEGTSVAGTEGFSGSPVFLASEEKSFVFIGILVGKNEKANGFYITKPKHLHDLISK